MKSIGLLLISLVVWSSASFATDYVVHVALVDGQRVTNKSVDRTDKLLRKRHKHLELVSIRVPVPAGSSDPAAATAVRRQVTAQLRDISFAAGQRVRMLILNAPAAPAPVQPALPPPDGFVTPDVADEGLIAPLLGHFRNDARIVLLGYETMAGEPADADARAGDILNYSGAPNGSAFGMVNLPSAARPPKLNRDRATVVGLTSLAIGLGIGAIALVSGEPEAAAYLGTTWSLGSFAVIAPATIAALRLRTLQLTLLKRINYGRLVQLRDGDVERVTYLRYTWDDKKIFDCEGRLTK